jgi:hypothetical protein
MYKSGPQHFFPFALRLARFALTNAHGCLEYEHKHKSREFEAA